jgi:uncharacterized membrane-anchored protein
VLRETGNLCWKRQTKATCLFIMKKARAVGVVTFLLEAADSCLRQCIIYATVGKRLAKPEDTVNAHYWMPRVIIVASSILCLVLVQLSFNL